VLLGHWPRRPLPSSFFFGVVMSVQLVLAIAVHFVVVAVALWDMFVLMSGRPNETVSLVTARWANGHPALPLLIGLVVGHLFWANCPTEKKVEEKLARDLVVKCQVK
jgi:hypothetical protein